MSTSPSTDAQDDETAIREYIKKVKARIGDCKKYTDKNKEGRSIVANQSPFHLVSYKIRNGQRTKVTTTTSPNGLSIDDEIDLARCLLSRKIPNHTREVDMLFQWSKEDGAAKSTSQELIITLSEWDKEFDTMYSNISESEKTADLEWADSVEDVEESDESESDDQEEEDDDDDDDED